MKTYEERTASVQKKLYSRKIRRRAITATTLVLCLCIVAGVLFMPYDTSPPDIQMHVGSDYYKVIQAINNYTYQRPEYDNLLDEWMGIFEEGIGTGDANMAVPGEAPEYGASISDSNNSSVEITDHQVAGVLEGDLIKRSETHIFYLNGSTLEIYPIAGEETKLLGTWKFGADPDTYYNSTEMYLSADATRLTLVVSGYGNVLREGKKDSFTQIMSLDVSDPKNVKEGNAIYITGSLLSSRMIGEQLMLMSQYRMDYEIDFEDQATFLPQYGTPGNMQSIPADGIVIPEELSNRNYTVVTLLDSTDLSMVDAGAFMSYSTELYVSKEHIYATRTYTKNEEIDDAFAVTKSMTEVSCMAYGEDGLTNQGTFCVEGAVKDQYSMDEHDGIFRIVTATNRRVRRYYSSSTLATDAQGNTIPPETDIISIPTSSQNANLTCFKVGSWEQVALVENFAPEGETVESVRFDGDYAYVCTAVVITLTDPVFFFDMTNLDNIIVKDTGTIDGYSSSLVQLSDGYLLGIGCDDAWNLKVEIYEETETGVAAVCEYIQSGNFATDYKAYFIDRENNLFGIPTDIGYILLQFDGYQLHELANAHYLGYPNNTRGVVIDKCLYVFSPQKFTVQAIG